MSWRDRVQVFGPAYLDRVLRVDRSLSGDPRTPLDQSVDGTLTFADGPTLTLRDPAGSTLTLQPPPGWPGPIGRIDLNARMGDDPDVWTRSARGTAWNDDLGGMGAGFAAALGGELVHALGADDDPVSAQVIELLRENGVRSRPVRVDGVSADWTLLVTSGAFGDKLGVGFRGCHLAMPTPRGVGASGSALRVVAALPNPLAEAILREPGATVRVFAPAVRNMTDAAAPASRLADAVDLWCCNRREWEALEDRERVAWAVSVLAVTDGPRGSEVRFTTPEGEAGRITVPAFPRSRPPVDTNRAGEAYAAALVATLLDAGWSSGVFDPAVVTRAAVRASAAAALVLDNPGFGFPDDPAIDRAVQAGRV
jgi:ribokinase